MRVGPLALGTLSDWEPEAGPTVVWQPSAAALATARQAPVNAVPASYMQEQHIRGYIDQTAVGLDYSRLMVLSCDMAGRCDRRAIDYIINAHVRRHETYRSWFEHADDGSLIRHVIDDPAEIAFVPVDHGELTLPQVRELLTETPDPLQWDCFRFGIIQGKSHFTFFASIDHVHVDAAVAGVTLMELYFMYNALVAGGAPLELPPAGNYSEFCVGQHEFTSALTQESPEIQAWRSFAESNDDSLPGFPLPLGDPTQPCPAAMVTATMLDEKQTVDFESACTDASARFIGGVLACCGLAQQELTGDATYYGLTPRDTRRSPDDDLTLGWFTGLIPITVPIGESSFADAAKAAQDSFDSGRSLADVPYQRVRELVPSLGKPPPNFPVVNFMDAGAAPLSALIAAGLDDLNIGVYSDGRYSYQMSLYVIRVQEETAVTAVFPDNPEAHESVARYLALLKSVFERIAEQGHGEKVA
ncbi:condensation domain-containing protein [[Mycobacterium] holstebronense]|uniref:Condensation domain-containing protein n=1 Tax=[Mycobacterium] holstebronense TaxID=3064288 RepID=A0ABN9NRS2_9MYCO|nr:condensation domain-containing protein [Mycolicibacter sp. MU0102]CAJ1510851.1 condensation domain-containing protein [Mycolicibacter sp. MU0102]